MCLFVNYFIITFGIQKPEGTISVSGVSYNKEQQVSDLPYHDILSAINQGKRLVQAVIQEKGVLFTIDSDNDCA